MNVHAHASVSVSITLQPSEGFDAEGGFGTTTHLRVSRLHYSGSSVTLTGAAYKKDGTVGIARRSIVKQLNTLDRSLQEVILEAARKTAREQFKEFDVLLEAL